MTENKGISPCLGAVPINYSMVGAVWWWGIGVLVAGSAQTQPGSYMDDSKKTQAQEGIEPQTLDFIRATKNHSTTEPKLPPPSLMLPPSCSTPPGETRAMQMMRTRMVGVWIYQKKVKKKKPEPCFRTLTRKTTPSKTLRMLILPWPAQFQSWTEHGSTPDQHSPRLRPYTN